MLPALTSSVILVIWKGQKGKSSLLIRRGSCGGEATVVDQHPGHRGHQSQLWLTGLTEKYAQRLQVVPSCE